MSEENKQNVFQKITLYSGVVTSLTVIYYIVGYISHIAYYRILIGNRIEHGAEEYIKFAGDATITVILSVVSLFTQPELIPLVIKILFGEALLLTSLLFCFFTIIFHIILINKQHLPIFYRYSPFISICIAFIFLITFEMQIFYTKEVLQPFKPEILYEKKKNLKNTSDTLTHRIDIINELLDEPYMQKDQPVRMKWFQFNKDFEEQKNERWAVFTIISILLIILFIFLFRHYELLKRTGFKTLNKIIVIIFVTSQILLFPIMYGSMGCSFIFPVITLELDKIESVKSYPVFLLAQTEKEIIIYNRYEFFQINFINKEKVLSINYLFNGSPFDGNIDEKGRYCPYELFNF